MIVTAECIAHMRTMPTSSIDAIVTDPPYGLGFMGKQWDDLPPSKEWADECLRVLKPGGHLLAFGGTRTYHRLAVAIEDAGFEIRDTICWLYGSGFPKSHNLKGDWQGWGTALKPAHEPVVVARKPFKGTVAANVLEHGTGAVNVDGCRVEGAKGDGVWGTSNKTVNPDRKFNASPSGAEYRSEAHPSGRWPANVVLDEDAAGMLDEQTGELTSGKMKPTHTTAERNTYGQNAAGGYTMMETYGDSGGASRFFYVAKASSRERNAGLDEFSAERVRQSGHADERIWDIPGSHATKRPNYHPTVKPIALMRWLVRLVTPPGGTVLDPFAGSGTTGIAAVLEGFDFIGIEREPEYAEIGKARIAHWTPEQLSLDQAA